MSLIRQAVSVVWNFRHRPTGRSRGAVGWRLRAMSWTGRRLCVGCGGGLVGIAAALAGARRVTAADVDPLAGAAARLNAWANGVAIEVRESDPAAAPPPDVDLVLAGDVFYAREVAERMAGFMGRCVAAAIEVLVGDPGRRDLPLDRLRLLASYAAPDFGGSMGTSAVYAFEG